MTLPRKAGLGFKPEHFPAISETKPDLGFFEIHAENYMGAGGMPHAMLERLRADYALSVHGVGLSIGGPDPLDRDHLARLKLLCDRYDPESFSEHLAWASHGGVWMHDLLPLPYTVETLSLICDHVDEVQEHLGRRMLLENPATYVLFDDSDIPETEFLTEISQRTGCGLLLDLNNVFVSCVNHRQDPRAYLEAFPLNRVGEIHLAGHEEEELPSGPLLIDSHGREVAEPVWALYAETVSKTGQLPSLIEWDNDVPDFATLMAEAERASMILSGDHDALAS
ncbi:DUF692 family multinuclear iron-containing protein [Thioclava sp. JE_KL1]|uniref:MNIO family bufferin maturase n=1 Tax=Thioclava sp. JE_KL1 TaxID=2651187 RepID=UPI00128D0345|nr:DUF692 domain-containing protein [Thioclava sp. JE_KL1]MPQ94225.1 DUF692 domain-containing protein [Thioclava sp. JE_KL1]